MEKDVGMWCELLARNCASSHGYHDNPTARRRKVVCVCGVIVCVCRVCV